MSKNLVIGKNSKIIKLVLEKNPNIQDQVCFISHSELSKVLHQEWNNIFVFSYSRKLSDNIKLAKEINLLKGRIVYISSISVKAAPGWLPQYPSVKLKCEKAFQNICNADIVRLGCFEEIYNFDDVGLQIPVTTINDVLCMVLLGAEEAIINDLYEFKLKGKRSLKMNLYLLIFRILKANLFLLRPIDLIFKTMQLTVYGYTLKAIRSENEI